MKPVTQDIVLMIRPPRDPADISWKGGNMALNRFCIDEKMANESSGVYHSKPSFLNGFTGKESK